MAYTTPAKVRTLSRKLPTSITDADINGFIDRAGNYVDALLGEVFATPFTTTPKIIEDITSDLAVFFLMESLMSSQAPNLDEYSYKRYDRAVDMLQRIVTGDLFIGVSRKAGQEAGFASTTDKDPYFTFEDPEW